MPQRLVADIAEIGPFFSGDTGPNLEFVLLWDGGGYVDLTGATITVTIRRWDNRRQQPIGAVITAGSCTITAATLGQCKFVWTGASPVATIPPDTGFYFGQVKVTFSDSVVQRSQRFIFEVKAS